MNYDDYDDEYDEEEEEEFEEGDTQLYIVEEVLERKTSKVRFLSLRRWSQDLLYVVSPFRALID